MGVGDPGALRSRRPQPIQDRLGDALARSEDRHTRGIGRDQFRADVTDGVRSWHGAVRDWPGPLSLAWGLLDPVAVPAILEGLVDLRPAVDPTTFPDLGHYPQVEDPDRFADALSVLAWPRDRASDEAETG